MVFWVVVDCSSKSGKHKGLGFFRIPKIITNQGKESEELTTRKRNEWISAVSHCDATNKRVNEFEANTSSSESQHSNCRPWKEEIYRKTTKMQPKEL